MDQQPQQQPEYPQQPQQFAQPSVQPPQPSVQGSQPYAQPYPQQQSNGFAITAMVLGIIAFLTGWASLFSFVTSIPAIVFGILGLVKRQNKAMSIVGIVLAGISILFVIGFLIFVSTVDTSNFSTSTY